MVQRMEEERIGMGSREGPTIPAPLAQTNTCRTVIKEKIKVSRTLTGEHYQHDKIGENPKKLTCNESKREELEDPQYEKQPCKKSLISGIREKELLGNLYMKIPKQKFISSYGSMPLKGVRKRSSDIPLEIRKNRSKTHSMLKHQGIPGYEIDRSTPSMGDGPLMELPEVACDSKVQSHRKNSGETGMSKGRPGPESSASS
ncbi:hypothetical protein Tco_0784794 [Tanacetum coccineum]